MGGVTVTIDGQTYSLSGEVTATLLAASTEITPAMTGPTTGQWSVSATSEYSESGQTASAWKACTAGNQPTWTDKWSSAAQATPSVPQVWTLQSSQQFQISSLHLISRPDATSLEPSSLQIIDNTTGAILVDSGPNPLSWAAGEEKVFAFATTTTESISVRVTNSGALCQFKVRAFS
jgi:hypothetical protein